MGDLNAIPEAKKSQVSGFMDLNLDRLSRDGSVTVIALSHYYKHPSGDMIPDPDMANPNHDRSRRWPKRSRIRIRTCIARCTKTMDESFHLPSSKSSTISCVSG